MTSYNVSYVAIRQRRTCCELANGEEEGYETSFRIAPGALGGKALEKGNDLRECGIRTARERLAEL